MPLKVFVKHCAAKKIDEKDHEFSHIFDLSLNSYHKKPILKNSKKVYAATCRPIALKNN